MGEGPLEYGSDSGRLRVHLRHLVLSLLENGLEFRGAAHKVIQLIPGPIHMRRTDALILLELEVSIDQAVEIQHARGVDQGLGEVLVGKRRRFVVMEWRDGECVLG
jgi:hypothetical protein